MKFLLLSFVVLVSGCASTGNKNVNIVATATTGCKKVAELSADGFSLIPTVGKSLAMSLLSDKAAEFKADTVVITQQEGVFRHTVKADGYKCKK